MCNLVRYDLTKGQCKILYHISQLMCGSVKDALYYMLSRIIVGINVGRNKKVYDLTVSLCFGAGG